MKMDKVKLSRLFAAITAVLVFTMIFINFASGLSCNGEGTGMMKGQPSLFNLMFGGFEGFKESTNILDWIYAVPGLQVAFSFEIVATVFFVVVLVSYFLGKQDSKIVSLLSILGIAFVLTSTILTFCTREMTRSAVITEIEDFSYGGVIKEIMNNVFKNNIRLGAGAIINGVVGILAIGTANASRIILRKSANAQ